MGCLKAARAGARVVSVGNITVGGTGKTPLVHHIAAEALRRGCCPAVLSRGYKGRTINGRLLNDEGMMLESKLPGLVLVQDADRVKAAKEAVDEKGADFLVLDDGFQHRRLSRDLDIVLVDAARPFGFGRLVPAGLLREPLRGLGRAEAIVLTRTDQVTDARLREIERIIGSHTAAQTPVFHTAHVPVALRPADGSPPKKPGFLERRKVFLFCGIANPAAFKRTVESTGAVVQGMRSFPDHHWYTRSDLEDVAGRAKESGADLVVTTEKDGVKIAGIEAAHELFVLEIGVAFPDGEDRFWDLVFSGR